VLIADYSGGARPLEASRNKNFPLAGHRLNKCSGLRRLGVPRGQAGTRCAILSHSPDTDEMERIPTGWQLRSMSPPTGTC
jgi:hypothetical protein